MCIRQLLKRKKYIRERIFGINFPLVNRNKTKQGKCCNRRKVYPNTKKKSFQGLGPGPDLDLSLTIYHVQNIEN